MTAKQKRFLKAPLADQVRLATPAARGLLLTGLDTRLSTEDDVSIQVEELIGHSGPADPNDEDCKTIGEALYTTYALGIAVGLLMRPAAFTGRRS